MEPTFLKIIERLFFIFRYHTFKQLLSRIWIKLITPIRYQLQMGEGFSVSDNDLQLQNHIPSLNDYELDHLPLKLIQPKYDPTLLLKNSIQTELEHFEIQSHRYLFFSKNKTQPWDIISDWIEKFPFSAPNSHRLAWHPYVISKRVQTWLGFWTISPPPQELKKNILISLFTQLLWLEKNLENDIQGNHLWENAQALILGGSFFNNSNSNRWLNRGVQLLKKCIEEQILPSGEHFEKSPSYHLELTLELQFLLPWLTISSIDNAPHFEETVKKMFSFAERIAHPSGLLPFFNDSWAMKIKPATQLETSWIGDYFVSKDSKHFLIFDAANLGPDSLPAHSHCDLLTFELSLGNHPIFINSGTHSYQGEKRNHYRSSAAHNVLVLNKESSADIWSSFRMGRRGHIIERGSKDVDHGIWVWAIHDAYRHVKAPRLHRVWFISQNAGLLCSFHFVMGANREYFCEEFLHLHPSVKPSEDFVNQSLTSEYFYLYYPDGKFTLKSLKDDSIFQFKNTTFAPHFKEEIPNLTLCLQNQLPIVDSSPNLASAWCLGFHPEHPNISWELQGKTIKLECSTTNQSFYSELSLPFP